VRVEAVGVLEHINAVIDSREVLTALLIALVTGAVGVVWAAFRRRRLIVWSVLYDEPINQGPVIPDGPNMWEIASQGREVEQGSLLVLDVRNGGPEDIEEGHFAVPLYFAVPGRQVVHFKVRDSDDLHDLIQRSADTLPPDDASKLVLPPLPLNRRTGFKLLVLLTGSGSEVKAGGIVRSGRIVQHVRHSRRNQVAAALAVVALLVGVSGGVWLANRALTPSAACATGALTVEGSSAFAPIATQIKNAYEQSCPGAAITVSANGSVQGLANLAKGKSPSTIAMYDGLPAQQADTGLTRRPVGVVVFAVVANRSLSSSLFKAGLSSDQLKAIFTDPASGGYVAVGRTAGSGTRAAFDSTVVHSDVSALTNAQPCAMTAAGAAAPTACTENTTMDLLNYVNRTPNAIGYAEADALPFFSDLGVVPIDGRAPTRDNALSGAYSFVATEYIYTAGSPAGLTADYLNYLTSDAMTARLRDHGYIGCSDLPGTKLDGACR
jgi:phosphate transport system substrate-binding protein